MARSIASYPASPIARIAMIALAALCASCAPNYVPVSSSTTNANSQGYSANGSTNVSGLTGNSSSSSTSGDTTATSSGTAPLITEQVSGVGYNSTSVTVSAASVLELTFTPGQQESNVKGTGYSPNYSELGVYITVNGNTQNTGMLSNGLYSAAEASPVLNFSSALSGTEGQVTITVSNPNNDYFCLNFGEYCPWTQVYKGQPWNGTLSIQTDDTVPITSSTSFL